MITAEKLDSKLFSKKALNIATIALSCFFVLFFIVSSCTYIGRMNEYEAMYAELVASANSYNIDLANAGAGNGGLTNKQEPTISYKTGKEAIVDAFKNFYNYSSYELKSYGNIDGHWGNVGISIDIEIDAYKFDSGNRMLEVARTSDFSLVNLTKATQFYYNSGKVFHRNTTDVTATKNSIKATYGDQFGVNDSMNPNIVGMYIVNNETVSKVTHFEKRYDVTGDFSGYYVIAELNGLYSTTEYGLVIASQMNSDKCPIFTKITLSAFIDAYGNLQVYKVVEDVSKAWARFNLLGSMQELVLTTHDEVTYTLISHDSSVSIDETTIELNEDAQKVLDEAKAEQEGSV